MSAELASLLARLQDQLATSRRPGKVVVCRDRSGLVRRGEAYGARSLQERLAAAGVGSDADMVVVCHPDEADVIGARFQEWGWGVLWTEAPVLFGPSAAPSGRARWEVGGSGWRVVACVLGAALMLVVAWMWAAAGWWPS